MEVYKDLKPKEPKYGQVKKLKTTEKIKELHLAILPGKPRCRVASIWPTSIPNSRAFVAATPQRFPPKKSLSILLLSCLVCTSTQKIKHFMDKLNYNHIMGEASKQKFCGGTKPKFLTSWFLFHNTNINIQRINS